MRAVRVHSKYKHFKGKVYTVIAIAINTTNEEYMVVYKGSGDDDVWARPYDEFMSEIHHKKYPDVTQKYRFEEVGDD